MTNITPVFQVSEFNEMVNQHLSLLSQVTIEGEISQLNLSQGKWLFITIKDAQASLEVFAFAPRISTLKSLTEGMLVQVVGQPRLYQKTGRFSVQASQIVPAGEGALQLAYEQLKSQLEKEGLFDSARKRPLPAFPTKIGLLTGAGSRAYSDFVKVLEQRLGGLKIYFFPVLVQGDQAAMELAAALNYVNVHYPELDVLVLTRGGGSLADLMAFNDERVARAVFASQIPVLSAIGHEADVALTDYIADLRASTPSNAAELLVASRQELQLKVDQLVGRLDQAEAQLILAATGTINDQWQSLVAIFNRQNLFFEQLIQRLISQQWQIQHRLENLNQTVATWANNLFDYQQRQCQQASTKLAQLERLLTNLDYRRILAKGFSVTRDANSGQIIRQTSQLKIGQNLTTVLTDGEVQSAVAGINPDH